jgi:tubulin-specific chaperone B
MQMQLPGDKTTVRN